MPDRCASIAKRGIPLFADRENASPAAYIISCTLCLSILGICHSAGDRIDYHSAGLALCMLIAVLPLFFPPGPVLAGGMVGAFTWGYFFIPHRWCIVPLHISDGLIGTLCCVVPAVGILTDQKNLRSLRRSCRQVPLPAAGESEASDLTETGRLDRVVFDALAHELRTPITSICGASSLLADRMRSASDKGLRTLASDIDASARRLNRAVTNLLDISRVESGTLRVALDWCDIGDVLNDVNERCSLEALSHPLRITVDDAFPILKIDSGLVSQAFTNIVVNAVQHSPERGEIILDARMENGIPVVSVSDEGSGFTREALSRVFEKFYRASPNTYSGMGLG
jgi:two-component system, OmpR family, sensor histidine kinase KdpD